MAERINKDNFEEKVFKSSLPVLVDFYSDSCVPCKMLSPILSNLEEERAGQLLVYKVNVNFDTELAQQYEVLGAPTLILFQEGQVLDRRTGALKKAALTEWIDEKIK